MKVALRRSPRNVSHIHKLPPEIWEKILKYLDYKSKFKALRVCKLWNELLENSPRIFWHNEIASVYHLADINTYSIAKKEFKGLNIHTNSCVGVCQLFVHKHPRVKLLSFQNCNRLNDYVISRAIDCLSGTLISLSLHNCKFVTDITLLNIALFLPKLELLDLSGCNNLTNEGLKHLAAIDPALNRNRFHKLRILHIDNIVTVRDDCKKNVLRTLKCLNVSGCFDLTDMDLEKIFLIAPNITNLNVEQCVRLSDAAMRRIAYYLTVTSLNVNQCVNITMDGMQFFLNNGKSHLISKLCMSQMWNVDFHQLVLLIHKCKFLKEIEMSFCYKWN
ncbi:glucose-induced repressor, putative, partial [Ixodes scapularis]